MVLIRPLHWGYSSLCILRPPLQPEKYHGLKLGVVLKWREICTENIRVVSLIAGLKIEGIVTWRGLKSQGPLYTSPAGGLNLEVPLYKYLWHGLCDLPVLTAGRDVWCCGCKRWRPPGCSTSTLWTWNGIISKYYMSKHMLGTQYLLLQLDSWSQHQLKSQHSEYSI